jgi:hypothetical protein
LFSVLVLYGVLYPTFLFGGFWSALGAVLWTALALVAVTLRRRAPELRRLRG